MVSYKFRWIMPEDTTTELPILQVQVVSSSPAIGGPPSTYSDWRNVPVVYNDVEYKKAKQKS